MKNKKALRSTSGILAANRRANPVTILISVPVRLVDVYL